MSKETQIFIKRLPKQITEEEVIDLFDRYGLIKEVIIKPHYTFVTFEEKMEAEEAIFAMNKYDYLGNRLIVEESKSRDVKDLRNDEKRYFSDSLTQKQELQQEEARSESPKKIKKLGQKESRDQKPEKQIQIGKSRKKTIQKFKRIQFTPKIIQKKTSKKKKSKRFFFWQQLSKRLKKLSKMEEVTKLRESLEAFDYHNKYQTWIKIFSHLPSLTFQNKVSLYTEFLEEFPFVFQQWNELAQLYCQKGNTIETMEVYRRALGLNKRSLRLWECYCAWVQDTHFDKYDVVKFTYDSALSQIGLDFYSGRIWDMYLRFEEKNGNYERINEIFWRLGGVPLKDTNVFILRYTNFIEKIDDVEILEKFIKQLEIADCHETELLSLRKYLQIYYEKCVQNTIKQVQIREPFEESCDQHPYSGKEQSNSQKQNWIKYIRFEQNQSKYSHPKILFLIEKALTYCCTAPEIWREYINFLENEMGTRDYLKAALHCYKKTLLNIDYKLVFLLADLYEMGKQENEAEELYSLLSSKNNNLEICQRTCEFFVRQQKSGKALEVYEQIVFRSSALDLESRVYLFSKMKGLVTQRSELIQLFEKGLKFLEFNLIVVCQYVSFLEEFLPYIDLIVEVFRIFEEALDYSRKHNTKDFGKITVLFQKTVREKVNDIALIFKLEKNLSKRFKHQPKERNTLWSKYVEEMKKDLHEEIMGVSVPIKKLKTE